MTGNKPKEKQEVMDVRHRCERCGGSMDTNEVVHYPGHGDVCEECEKELDREAEHRKQWRLTRQQQEEIKRECSGIMLGA